MLLGLYVRELLFDLNEILFASVCTSVAHLDTEDFPDYYLSKGTLHKVMDDYECMVSYF